MTCKNLSEVTTRTSALAIVLLTGVLAAGGIMGFNAQNAVAQIDLEQDTIQNQNGCVGGFTCTNTDNSEDDDTDTNEFASVSSDFGFVRQLVAQNIENIDGSEVENFGDNEAIVEDTLDFAILQNNEQEIEDVDDGSSTENIARSDANINDDSNNNEVKQENGQGIEDVDNESNASNEASNEANIDDDSDDNDVDQETDQSVDGVDDGSSANNSGGNSANIS